ncbi:MAG: Uma2 family endonuclease [Selenomonas sp.]|uniref:Uma2 family endonuclease n=1 Tax=Selenomonas sp. TaxID=2053611 RepID=UPI0025FC7515|nr:Uma2 family endonuclease [Selenomonas sp.]MCI6101263.1 Uma2 family endonuclease [Selenomonas sp.]MCI6232362.1 Uma2 family endonuclease [Selenomonas sp.]
MDNLAYQEPPRVERIEGRTYLMSPRPKIGHNRVCTNIASIFANYLMGKPCVPFADGTDVYLDDENHYIPDAMIVCDRSIIHDDAIYGAPDLVVEVLSPSTTHVESVVLIRHKK